VPESKNKPGCIIASKRILGQNNLNKMCTIYHSVYALLIDKLARKRRTRTWLTDVSEAATPFLLRQSTIFIMVTRHSEPHHTSRLRAIIARLQWEEFTLAEMSVKVCVKLLKFPAHCRLTRTLICQQTTYAALSSFQGSDVFSLAAATGQVLWCNATNDIQTTEAPVTQIEFNFIY